MMEVFKGPHIYKPLRGSDIRVVRFLPYSPTLDNYHRVEGVLSHVPLDTSADFFALSYVWGDPKGTSIISLNGKDFPVTNNLWWAIIYLRNRFDKHRRHRDTSLPSISIDQTGDGYIGWEDYTICWWIDAICINQADMKERSIQVPRMKNLYTTATRVVVWWGHLDDDKSDPLTAQVILAAEKNFQAVAQSTSGKDNPDLPVEKGVEILPSVVSNVGELIRPTVNILKSGNLWLGRIWTLQEAVLGQDPALMIGKEVTTLKKLRLLRTGVSATVKAGGYDKYLQRHDLNILAAGDLQNLASLASKLADRPPENAKAPESSRGRLDKYSGTFKKALFWTKTSKSTSAVSASALDQFGHELLERLAFFSIRQATVPHDRIYGLLGLTNLPILPSHLTPDYSRAFGEVCLAYARFLIERTRSLHVLALGAGRLQGFPTWVPDFTLALHANPTATIQNAVFSDNGRCLTVRGTKLGEAAAVHCDSQLRAMDPQEMPSEDQVMAAFWDLAKIIIRPASQIRGCDVNSVLEEWSKEAFVTVFGGSIDDILSLTPAIAAGGEMPTSWDSRALACVQPLSVLFQFSTFILLRNGTVCHWYHKPDRVNEKALVGDYVYVLRGTTVPTLLRPLTAGDGFEVVGTCWPYPVSGNNFPEEYFNGRAEESIQLH